MSSTFVYYAKEDPWQDDLDGQHGLPIILARRGTEADSEAIWRDLRGAWEPFPDLFERLMGGDWWEQITEARARRYFDATAFDGGPIQEPLPPEQMDQLLQESRQHQQAEAQA